MKKKKKEQIDDFELSQSHPAMPALVFGIIAIVVALIGSVGFGVFGACAAILFGVLSIFLGHKARKITSYSRGTAGMKCGITALVLAAVMGLFIFLTSTSEINITAVGMNGNKVDMEDILDSWFYGVVGVAFDPDSQKAIEELNGDNRKAVEE